MKNNVALIAVVTFLVGAGLGFFGGSQFQKGKTSSFGPGQFPDGQTRDFQGRPDGTQVRNSVGGNVGGPVSGEITSIENDYITVSTQDGGSKIVIYSDSTTINKTSEGSMDDLQVGEEVMIIGKEGSDGTVTAETISIGGNYFRGGMPQEEPPTGDN